MKKYKIIAVDPMGQPASERFVEADYFYCNDGVITFYRREPKPEGDDKFDYEDRETVLLAFSGLYAKRIQEIQLVEE